MADLIINGTTYSGTPINTANPQRPDSLKRRRIKVGTLIKNANGGLTWVHRGFKNEWTITWKRANEVTQVAVIAVWNLTASFPFVDVTTTSYTAITVGDDPYEEDITTNRVNAYRYGLELVIREA